MATALPRATQIQLTGAISVSRMSAQTHGPNVKVIQKKAKHLFNFVILSVVASLPCLIHRKIKTTVYIRTSWNKKLHTSLHLSFLETVTDS